MNKLLSIGKDLITGNFSGAVKSLSNGDTFIIDPGTYHTPDNGSWLFETLSGQNSYFKYEGMHSCIEAFTKCPPVNAIINRKAQAYINGKTWVLNKQGKEAQSEAAKKIRNLLLKPNPLQSWKQFEAQGYIYEQLFGYSLVLSVKPFGFKDNIDASALWNIPPSMVDIEETKKLFYQADQTGMIKQIVLFYKGERTVLEIGDVYIFKDITPSFDTLVLPESRIKSLRLPINNIIGAFESRNVLINYRGALGILSHEQGSGEYSQIPISDTEKKELQKDLRRYGLKERQWQFIITSAALKWQQMGVPTKDLMLFEEVEADTMSICDNYNYAYQLMSSAKGTTFSNLQEGKKLLYQDAIIPEAESNYEQWDRFFDTDRYGLTINKDYCHIPVLQDDEVQKATARRTRNEAMQIEWQNGLITRNQWRVANGDDPVPGDDVYIWQVQSQTQNNGNGSEQTGAQEAA